MDREEALLLVRRSLTNPALASHSLAAEAVMRGLARRLGGDEELWGLAGLLHDIDYERTANEPEKHGLEGGRELEALGLDAGIVRAVKAHNEATGTARETLMDHALYAADPATGLITACALVRPSKKLAQVEVSSVAKKFKDPSFARGASRAQIDACARLGLERNEFLAICLDAMKDIAGTIGL